MGRRFLLGWCVLLLLLWGLPIAAVAQEQDGDAEEAAVEETDISSQEEVPEAVDDESVEADGQGDEVAEEPVPSEAESAEEGDAVRGPGGAPLRTDYPGTEESLQPRMDTGRIDGLDVPEGSDPDEVYDLRVRELETEIDDLKERVFRSKSRIALLRETVLSENLAGSRAVLTFINDLGRRYTVERAIFSVDGSQVFSSIDPNGRFDDEVEIFSGPMTPGTHTVSVTLGLRGSGYGVFSYARGYQFDLRFSCQFTAEEGRTTLVTVRSYKSGNALTAHEERPDGVCQVRLVELDVADLDTDVPELD